MIGTRTAFTLHPQGAHTRNTTTGSVVTLTRPLGSAGIIIQNVGATGANIRYVLDEGTPSTTVGFNLAPVADGGDIVRIDFRHNDFKYFAAASAELQYQWFS
jgi:hypothetical protein